MTDRKFKINNGRWREYYFVEVGDIIEKGSPLFLERDVTIGYTFCIGWVTKGKLRLRLEDIKSLQIFTPWNKIIIPDAVAIEMVCTKLDNGYLYTLLVHAQECTCHQK